MAATIKQLLMKVFGFIKKEYKKLINISKKEICFIFLGSCSIILFVLQKKKINKIK